MTEAGLYAVKYWDNRLLTPKGATLTFALEFFRAYAAHKEAMGDRPFLAVRAAQKLNVNEPERWRDWRAMERLRRFADGRGMKYWEFWELAFHAYIELKMPSRLTKRGTVIVPFGVFSNRSLLVYVIDRHQSGHAQFIRYADSPFFQSENYCGHSLQDAYYQFILAELSKSRRLCTGDKIRDLIDDGKLSRKFLEKYAKGAV